MRYWEIDTNLKNKNFQSYHYLCAVLASCLSKPASNELIVLGGYSLPSFLLTSHTKHAIKYPVHTNLPNPLMQAQLYLFTHQSMSKY